MPAEFFSVVWIQNKSGWSYNGSFLAMLLVSSSDFVLGLESVFAIFLAMIGVTSRG